MKLWALIPELILGGLCLVLVPLAGWVRGQWRVLPGLMALLGMLACLVATARMLSWQPVMAFHGSYALDGFAHVFKLIIELSSLMTVALLMIYFRGRSQQAPAAVAVMFATLGAVGLASSRDLGLIVLFFQMMSMASYVLVALERCHRPALEAALKYFIYAGVALAIMAYGLTFLYGLTGSLNLQTIGSGLRDADGLWVTLALILILVGYGFEITLAPFHVWAPDVFAGATAPVAGFLAVVPKAAGMAALLRFMLEGMLGEMAGWPLWLAIGAAVTMTLGNLIALRQNHLKRLLAWSSIAHAGYLLMTVAVAERETGALAAIGYYLAGYLFMTLGAFAVGAHLERATGSDSYEALRGLSQHAPGTAGVLALCLLSLAGIPPLAGFAGKVFLLAAVLEGEMIGLAVIAVINMTLALYYYVKIIAEVYLYSPVQVYSMPMKKDYLALYSSCLAGILGLGIWPGPLLALLEVMG
ncbi:NADH-quinone oxidoreductase subunit N [Nitrosococcus watsonii]|uniref:NADH-quinone oxidoreductase subunit N n=1 Tax=Nitrosococcus watsoni (strain C-113) TaxID=105559 RepID=D8KA41_NITWC|nr:proton-conducting transporter membrane subunit [Nitrosococcus watsonii]ADJ29399.1 NADH/Ubiquinone/plastoquinone (complex I) [Nitrosococcus watsonii C-113]